jgi:hypothetical protein
MAFWLGLNLPWLDYGGDFGKNAWQPDGGLAAFPSRRARLEATFASLADKGWRVLRWFLLCDGRAGVRFSPRGDPQGLDDRVFADVDQALSLASAHGLQVMFAVLDFHWFDKASTSGGVRMGGNARTVSDARLRGRLLDSVLAPLFTRYASEPIVWGWDLCNEPEWAVKRVSAGRASVTPGTMRAFLSESAALAHGLVKQPVTVGLATVRGLDLVTGIGLDFYQAHWYDSVEAESPLAAPVADLSLDRPLILGEYPTKGSQRTPRAIVATAQQAGWAAALAWSVLAQDPATDFASLDVDPTVQRA